MQGGKYRLRAKAYFGRDGTQFLRQPPSNGETENWIQGSANTWPRPESFTHHAYCTGTITNVKWFPFGETVTERRYQERPSATNSGLDGFDQKIQTLFI